MNTKSVLRLTLLSALLCLVLLLGACTTTPNATPTLVPATVAPIATLSPTLEPTMQPEASPSAPAGAGNYKPGTYEATARGYGGDVTVSLTVDATKITAATATGANETQDVGTKALDQVPKAMVDSGNADVDTVSGATVTSDAIIKAAKEALTKAAP